MVRERRGAFGSQAKRVGRGRRLGRAEEEKEGMTDEEKGDGEQNEAGEGMSRWEKIVFKTKFTVIL